MGTPPSIEVIERKLTEDVLAYITDPRIPEENGEVLRARVEHLDEGKRKAFLQKLGEAVEGRVKVLEHSAIDRNLLKKRLELFLKPQEKAEGQSGAPKEEKETFTERLQKEWEAHPVRTTVTGAVIVLGALSIASWIANRFKKATEAGRQAMQTGGSWLKRIAIATGVSLGVFLGLKAYKEYKVVKPYLDALKRRPEGHSPLPWLLQQFGFGRPETPKPPEPPPPAPPIEELPLVSEAVQESAESLGRELTGRGIVLMHEELAKRADLKISDSPAERSHVSDVLHFPVVRSLDIKTLLRMAERESFDGARTAIREALIAKGMREEDVESLSEKQLRAIYFLALVCKQNGDRLPRLFGEEDVSTKTLDELLDHLGHATRLLARMEHSMQGVNLMNPNDIARRLTAVFTEHFNWHQESASPSVREKLRSLGIPEGKEAAFITFCLERPNAKLKTAHLGIDDSKPDQRIFRGALANLQKEFLDEQGKVKKNLEDYLSLYVHGEQDFRDPLESYLREHFKVPDALQLLASMSSGVYHAYHYGSRYAESWSRHWDL